MQRVFQRSPSAFRHFADHARTVLARRSSVDTTVIARSIAVLERHRVQTTLAREVLVVLGYTASSLYLLEHVQATSVASDQAALESWLREGEWSMCLTTLESSAPAPSRARSAPFVEQSVQASSKL